MKTSIFSFALGFIFLVALALPAATVKAGEGDAKPLIVAAAQSSKQKQTNACRARYRDCVKLNQIPTFECQYIYSDCINHIY
jgi:hypothetical protein